MYRAPFHVRAFALYLHAHVPSCTNVPPACCVALLPLTMDESALQASVVDAREEMEAVTSNA